MEILNKYVQLDDTLELEKYKNNVFILFRSDYIIPGSYDSFKRVPRIVGYWPKEKNVELYNPKTKRIAAGAILSMSDVKEIMESKSFQNYFKNYDIYLSAFIIEQNEKKYFNAQVVKDRIAQEKDEKLAKEKEKNNQYKIILNQNDKTVTEINNLCLLLVNELFHKIFWESNAAKNGYFKLFSSVQKLLVQNLMWIFYSHPRINKLPQLSFLKSNIFKYWYNNLFWECSLYYINELNYELTSSFKQELLINSFYSKIYYYFNELFSNNDVKQKLKDSYKSWRLKISKLITICNKYGYEDDDFTFNSKVLNTPSEKDELINSQYIDDSFIKRTKYFVYELSKLIKWYLI